MIAYPYATSWSLPAECSEQNAIALSNANVDLAQYACIPPNQMSSRGPVAILWDIENCPAPVDVRPEDVAGNIRTALQVHPAIEGAVMMFSAYGDFNVFSRRLREGCQRTGVKLVDVPNGRKDAADKAILVDMFLFALDNPPPSSIMLISGDIDFAPALHVLGQRGYTVILAIPSGVGVSSAFCSAAKFVWDWPSVAHGGGFVPPIKSLVGSRDGWTGIPGFMMGSHVNESNDVNGEDTIVYHEPPQNHCKSRDFSLLSHRYISATTTAPVDQCDTDWWSQPGDINGLKGQLVKLLEFSGGCLPLGRIPAEYQKVFGRPLYISEYGEFKLVNLLKKMSDVMFIEGKGKKKFVYLRNVRAGRNAPLLSHKNDKKDERVLENVDPAAVSGSSFSDEKVVVEEKERPAGEEPTCSMAVQTENEDENIARFKHELQEILVSYSCKVFLDSFEAIYQQRYKKPLSYSRLGARELDELFKKVRDVVILDEEPVTKRKFLAAALG